MNVLAAPGNGDEAAELLQSRLARGLENGKGRAPAPSATKTRQRALLNNRIRKPNVCLCTLVVPQLLRGGSRAAGEVTGYSRAKPSGELCSAARSPASPSGRFWSLSGTQLNLPAQKKTSSSSSAHRSPIPEGAEWAGVPGGEAALAQGRWGTHTPPSTAVVNRLRPCRKTTPQENLQTRSERAYPFLQTHPRPNKQHRGWQGKRSEDKRTEG